MICDFSNLQQIDKSSEIKYNIKIINHPIWLIGTNLLSTATLASYAIIYLSASLVLHLTFLSWISRSRRSRNFIRQGCGACSISPFRRAHRWPPLFIPASWSGSVPHSWTTLPYSPVVCQTRGKNCKSPRLHPLALLGLWAQRTPAHDSLWVNCTEFQIFYGSVGRIAPM